MSLTGNHLFEADLNIIQAYNYKVDVNLGDRSFKKLPRAFPSPPIGNLPSLTRIRRRIAFISGIEPVDYHCCIKSCCCFTGPFATQTTCPYCGETRYTDSGSPRKIFQYIPLAPRLRALYADPDTAKTLRYRHDYQPQPGVVADIFDGSHYKSLCGTNVTIEGESLGYKFFSQPTDIAIGLSTDGFGPFKRRKQTCWPIIVFLYNFPPEIRVKLVSIFSLGMIPGPTAPKDYDSFLVPFVEEMLKLARGVPARDAYVDCTFMLRVYLLLVFGDMPALAKMLRIKSTNALLPCRACRIVALRDPAGGPHAHYYAALKTPSGPSYDPLGLPLRTHDEFIRQALQVATAEGTTQSDLAIRHGIHGVPVLTTLSSIAVPASFPHDFMHILENIIPMLVSHWTGAFKGLGVGSGDYEIPKAVWEAIGQACATSGSTIPTAFGARVPNVATLRYQFIAETWILFATFVGPVVLQGRFTQPVYYEHFISLVKLINLCLMLEISEPQLQYIEKGFAAWVMEYERSVSTCSAVTFGLKLRRLYYQHQFHRLPACTMPVHALLHIADDIRQAGPVWCYWAFAMERYCGLLANSTKSRRDPFISLSRRIRDIEELKLIRLKYNLTDVLDLDKTIVDAGQAYPQCTSFHRLFYMLNTCPNQILTSS